MSGAHPRQTPEDTHLAGVVHRNIEALLEMRREFDRRKGVQDRFADKVTAFTGSMRFVLLHAALVTVWLLINTGVLPIVKPFDPYPFVMLAMIASVEAIFLSTFVLISQNRMAALDDRRADLDLQISLLSEHEITRLITMVEAISRHLDLRMPHDLQELKKDVAPEVVLQEIESASEKSS